MHNEITFTPNDIVTMILALSAGIVTISGAISAIASWFTKAKQPEQMQNERLAKCEERLDQHDEKLNTYMAYFQSDDLRLRKIEESNRITQRSMLALLKHSINGDDLESLRKAEKDLEEYLINKEN